MTFSIVCYGVRPNERQLFEAYNKYDYELTLVEDLLNRENVEVAKGHDAVLLRGNCLGDKLNLDKLKDYGIRYVFTRTVGYNHIDLAAAEDNGQIVARVPGYSPNAIAELSFTMAMTLLRSLQYTAERTAKGEFRVSPQMFSREVRNCTVAIIGVGRIGLVEAQMYRSMGAKVVGYDVYQSQEAQEVVRFMSLEEALACADIVSIHVPYLPGENDEMINQDFIQQMKKGAILVNTSRGEIQDNAAIVEAVKSGYLEGFATDVLPGEADIFFNKFEDIGDIADETVQEMLRLYPKILITPHVGSNTDEAVKNMIEYSMDNFNEYLTTGELTNQVSV